MLAPQNAAIVSASSLIVMARAQPMFITFPAACGDSAAARFAATTFSTGTKSRVWRPSP
jgi:hypothetical protein